MQFEEKYDYPASFETTWTMYQSTSFNESRFKEARLTDVTTEVVGDHNSAKVHVTAAVPAASLPAVVSKVIQNDVQVDIEENWSRTGDFTANGTTKISVKGAPVTLSAESVLSGDGSQATRVMVGELKVNIPILGRKLETEAMRLVPRIIGGEQKAAASWLEQSQ